MSCWSRGRWLCHHPEEAVRKEAENRDLCTEGFCRARNEQLHLDSEFMLSSVWEKWGQWGWRDVGRK